MQPVPTNWWTACVEVRTKRAIGMFYQHFISVRAEPRDVKRYILEDVDMHGLEARNILWIGKVQTPTEELP